MFHTRVIQHSYCRSKVSALAKRLQAACSAGPGTGAPGNGPGTRALHEGRVVVDVGLGQHDHILQVQRARDLAHDTTFPYFSVTGG